MKTNKAFNAIRNTSLETKFVSILLTIALVLMQTPLSWAGNSASDSGDADAVAQTTTATVQLDFGHSYIKYDGQTVAPPSTNVSAPLGEEFTFAAYADTGYELDSVEVTKDGSKKELSADSDGTFTIPAQMMAGTVSLSVESEQQAAEAEEATKAETATEEKAEKADDTAKSEATSSDEAKASEKKVEASSDKSEKAAKSEPTKAKYTYKDGDLKVTATLTDATAVPDNAKLVVTPVTSETEGYNYSVYMDALNKGVEDEASKYTEDNSLLYDVAFMVQKTDDDGKAVDGQYIEYEPAAGSVKLSFEFKGSQLSDGFEAEESKDVEIKHLPLSDEVRASVDSTAAATDISTDDVTIEEIEATATPAEDKAELKVDSLSVFVFKDGGQKNTWSGINSVDIESVLSALGDATQYAAYANKFINGTHLEGNIKVGVLDAIASDAVLNQSANVIQRTAVDKITVTKTVSEGASGTFKMAAYAADDVAKGKELCAFEITVPEGQTSASYVLTSENAADAIGALSSKDVVIYELDSNGSVVENGGTLDNKYTVSYTGNEVKSSKSTEHFTNYIGSITNSKSTDGSVTLNQNYFDADTFGSHTYIESMNNAGWGGDNDNSYTFSSTTGSDTKTVYVKDYKGRDANLSNISQKDGITAEVSGKLTNLSEYSASLATAKNQAVSGAGSLSVVNLTSTTGKLSSDFDAANFKSVVNGEGITETLNEDGYLLVNIDVTGFDTYSLDQITIDGQNADGKNEELARHIIYNFVTHSGTMDGNGNWSNYSAYAGTVTFDNVAAGTVLAPAATVVQSGGLRGTVIANVFDRTGGAETHKDSLVDQRNAKVFVNNATNEVADTDATVEVKKNFNNWGESSSFDFNIEAAGATELDGATTKSGEQPMPESTTVTAKSADAVNFGTVKFTETGIYKYKVTEVIPDGATEVKDESGKVIAYTKDGITYDSSIHYATVTVTESNGQLSAAVSYSDGDSAAAAMFTNTYTSKGTSASLVAHKNFKQAGFLDLSVFETDKELKGGEFTFEVLDSTGKQVVTATNNDKGEVSFPAISYTKADTYTYTIKEVIPADAQKIPGVTYDDTVYTATVVVEDNGAGQLEVKSISYAIGSEGTQGATFTNKYKASEAKAKLQVTKSFNNWGDSSEFEFVLSPVSAVAADGKTAISNPLAESTTAKATTASKTAVFDELTYQQAGTYTYAITEVVPDGATEVKDESGKVIAYVKDGITYDSAAHKVVVTVVDNNGQLSASAKYDVTDSSEGAESLTVTNTYNADKTSASLEAQKTLSGKKLAKDQFSFQLYEKAADGTLALLQTETNDAEGKIAFDAVEYSETGEHNYVIKEVVPDGATKNADGTYTKDGYTYDASEHEATVKVTDDGKGKLVAEVTYADGAAPTFANAYDAKGSVVLNANKATTNGLSKAGYTFQVKDGDEVVATGTSNEKGEVTFSPISYQLSDAGKTFNYTISEVAGSAKGVTYDENVYTVSVKVTDNGDGTLATEVTYQGGTAPTFTNEYNTKGETGLEATKYMDGRAFQAGDSYSFTVTPKDNAPAFSKTKVTITPTEGTSAKVDFGTAKFIKAGTYVYEIAETSTSANGVTVDAGKVTVTIVATDNGDGTLSFAKTYTKDGKSVEAATFTNTYKVEGKTSAQFKATKSVAEGSAWEDGDTFDIQLKDKDGKVLETKTATKTARTVAFSAIEYTADTLAADVKSGKAVKATASDGKITYTYSYTIAEDTSKLPKGVTAVVSTQNVTVVVTENTVTGKLSSKTYIESDGKMVEGNEAGLVNQYTTTGTSVFLEATKNLTGRTLVAGEFSFQLKDKDGNVLQTKTNAADGKIAFDAISYDAVGTYEYTIVEVAGSKGGVSYDNATQSVTVTVTKEGNKLVPEVAYGNTEGAVFSNTYNASGSIELKATKSTTNGLSKAGFNFVVEDEAGNQVATGTSDENGNIAFGKIDYALADAGKTFTYKVKEVAGSASGVTYDSTVYTVKVAVSDNGDGTLSAVPTIEGASAITFTNSYDASGSIPISGMKELQGKTLEAGMFTFQLTGEGIESMTAANAADGSFSFGAINYSYSQIGDHTYTVTEVIPQGATQNEDGTYTLDGITYSQDVYQVVVNVAEGASKDGKLLTSIKSVTKNGVAVEGLTISFTNTYDANTELGLEGKKAYENGTLEENQFGFTVYEKGGLLQEDTAVATGTVAADGAISFDKKLSYGLADLDGASEKTFNYVVKENIPEGLEKGADGTYFDKESGITYDGKQYSFSVTVTDKGDGTLGTEVTGDESISLDPEKLIISGLDFANSYFNTDVELQFDKYYFSNASHEFTFELTAADADGSLRTTVPEQGLTNGKMQAKVSEFSEDHKGLVTFGKITYTESGTYYYVVEELEQAGAGRVSMDATQYLVKVDVAEDGTVTKSIKVKGEEGDFEPMTSDNSAFYNNRIVRMNFMSYAMGGDQEDAYKTKVDPKVAKKLKNADGTDAAMEAGQFTFELVDATTGNVIETATNAADGVVDFSELTYTEEGAYTYTIREVAGNSTSITYDSTVYTMVVNVALENDKLEATTTYSSGEGTYTAEEGVTFTNTFKGMNIRVQKVSREGGEGLVNCTYALWMVTPEGDVKIGEAESDESGYITFKNVNMIKGVKYYFKEEIAPEGHTVDPYRTKYFTLNDEGTKLIAAEKAADDGWHAAGYKEEN